MIASSLVSPIQCSCFCIIIPTSPAWAASTVLPDSDSISVRLILKYIHHNGSIGIGGIAGGAAAGGAVVLVVGEWVFSLGLSLAVCAVRVWLAACCVARSSVVVVLRAGYAVDLIVLVSYTHSKVYST